MQVQVKVKERVLGKGGRHQVQVQSVYANHMLLITGMNVFLKSFFDLACILVNLARQTCQPRQLSVHPRPTYEDESENGAISSIGFHVHPDTFCISVFEHLYVLEHIDDL